jgi:hypothetical protein
MPSTFPPNRRSSDGVLLAVAAACFAILLAPAATPASVAGTGAVTLTVAGKGRAAGALASAGVKVVAIAPASKRGKRVVLPVSSIAVAGAATVAVRGGIRFEAGGRVATLRSLRLRLSATRAEVGAKAGRRRLVVFRARQPRRGTMLDRSRTTARIAGAELSLTPKAAKLLRRRLQVPGVSAGRLGRLAVDAAPKRRGPGGAAPGDGGPGAGSAPPGAPTSGPVGSEPPVLARPATAVAVGEIAIAWYPRDSWIRYLTTGVGPATPQNGFFAGGGATKGPPTTSSSHPCSDVAYGGTPSDSFDFAFHYAPRSGWYDPPTQSAAIYGQGSVRFRWQSHGIDLVASDPEIELDPANPRVIFRLGGSSGTAYSNQRAALIELDLAGQPVVSGDRRTYTAVRGRLTQDGQAVFAGFYPPPDDAFGCVTVSFATS